MKNVSFKLPETLDEELGNAARAARTTRSDEMLIPGELPITAACVR